LAKTLFVGYFGLIFMTTKAG